jgi:hypothetical protein
VRKIILHIALLTSLFGYSQEQLNWVSDVLDTSAFSQNVKSLEEHSAIWPKLKNRRGTKADTIPWDKVKKFSLFPASDMVAGMTHNQFQIKTGLGLGMNWIPMKGMNFQLGYLGGISNTNLINYAGGVYPTAYFRIPEKNELVQYHDIRARLSYSPNKYFNFQLGLDNNKIGEGDRSLLLGNYGTPSPFAQIRMNVWRIEYMIIYQFLREPNGNGGYFSKYATTHYLSIKATKRFTVGLFESVIWKGKDSLQNRGYEWEYLNPIMFFRPTEYSLGSSDNVLMGLNLDYKLNRSFQIYGQLMLDEFLLSAIKSKSKWWGNKYGIQFGVKGYAPFGWKSVSYFSEFNFVRPFTYSHGSTGQSYSNDNSVLAHPYGANFMETNNQIKWQKKKWDVQLNVIYMMRGADNSDTTSWGGNVLKSYTLRPKEYGYSTGNGNQYHTMKAQLTVGYQLIPKWKLRGFITGELAAYTQNNKISWFPGVYFGIRTELWNDKRNY